MDREYPPHWQLVITLSHTTTRHLDGGCPSPTRRPPFSAKVKQPRSLPVRLAAGGRLYLVPVLGTRRSDGGIAALANHPSRPRFSATRSSANPSSNGSDGETAGQPKRSRRTCGHAWHFTGAWRRTSRSLNASRSKIQRRSRRRRTANDQRGQYTAPRSRVPNGVRLRSWLCENAL